VLIDTSPSMTEDALAPSVRLAEKIQSEAFGPVVIVGCSHPGVKNILQRVHTHHGTPHALIGGLHDFDDFELLDSLERVLPCHCTTKKAEILAAYPRQAQICAAGTHLTFG